jgi:hypothetical protein
MILAWVMAGTVLAEASARTAVPAVVGQQAGGDAIVDSSQAIFAPAAGRRSPVGRLLRLLDSGIAALRAGTEAPANMVF